MIWYIPKTLISWLCWLWLSQLVAYSTLILELCVDKI